MVHGKIIDYISENVARALYLLQSTALYTTNICRVLKCYNTIYYYTTCNMGEATGNPI